MSATIALSSPDNWQAPITLAAGPESTVPIGFSIALSRLASEPSPLTSISGASILWRARIFCTEVINSLIGGTMRAFRAAVSARRGAPRLEASS